MSLIQGCFMDLRIQTVMSIILQIQNMVIFFKNLNRTEYQVSKTRFDFFFRLLSTLLMMLCKARAFKEAGLYYTITQITDRFKSDI